MVRPTKTEMEKNIISALKKAPGILDEQFWRDKELKKKSLHHLISDFDYDEIIDSLDQGKVPESLKRFIWRWTWKFLLEMQVFRFE